MSTCSSHNATVVEVRNIDYVCFLEKHKVKTKGLFRGPKSFAFPFAEIPTLL